MTKEELMARAQAEAEKRFPDTDYTQRATLNTIRWVFVEGYLQAHQDIDTYEYGWATDINARNWYETFEEAAQYTGNPQQFKRRKAGPWEAV